MSKLFRWPAALAFVVLVAAGLYGVVGRQGPQTLIDLASRLLIERREAASLFVRINGVVERSHLVVAESDTVATGVYESSKEVLGIDLGTTALSFEVPVRYFYAVDLSGPEPIDFSIDADEGVLWARFPALHLFSMEPDLGRLEQQVSVGWGRLARFSGADVRRRFRDRVMADLRTRGSAPTEMLAARAPARKRLEEMTRSFITAYAPDAAGQLKAVAVRFADEPEAPR